MVHLVILQGSRPNGFKQEDFYVFKMKVNIKTE